MSSDPLLKGEVMASAENYKQEGTGMTGIDSMLPFFFLKKIEERYGAYEDEATSQAVSEYVYQEVPGAYFLDFLFEDLCVSHDEKLGPPTLEQIKEAPVKAAELREKIS